MLLAATLAAAFAFPLTSAGKSTGAGVVAARCLGAKATKVGTSRGELIRGTRARDVVVAGAGDDIIVGLEGDDVICAGAGNDRVHGGPGNDRISGGPGHDFLDVEAGSVQTVAGGAGTDFCQRAARMSGCERTGPPTAGEPPCSVPGCSPSRASVRAAAAPTAPARPLRAAAAGNLLLGVAECVFASWDRQEFRQYPPAVTAVNRTNGVDREYVWWFTQEYEYNYFYDTMAPSTDGDWARVLATDYEYTDDFVRYDNGAEVGWWFVAHFPGSAVIRYWKNWVYWQQPNGTWEYSFFWGASPQGYALGC